MLNTNYEKGLLIDVLKLIVSLAVLSYLWYILKYQFLTLLVVPEIVYRTIQYYADSLIYYVILGVISLITLISDKLIEEKDFTPSYSKGFPPSEAIIALAFSLVITSTTLYAAIATHTIFEIKLLPRLILALTNTVKAIIENMFFIGVIGFALYKLLAGRLTPFGSALLSSTVVGFVAAYWHLFQLHIIQVLIGPELVLPVLLSKFVFFFLGNLLSLYYDNVWAMDIMHGVYNFVVTLFGKTLIPIVYLIYYG